MALLQLNSRFKPLTTVIMRLSSKSCLSLNLFAFAVFASVIWLPYFGAYSLLFLISAIIATWGHSTCIPPIWRCDRHVGSSVCRVYHPSADISWRSCFRLLFHEVDRYDEGQRHLSCVIYLSSNSYDDHNQHFIGHLTIKVSTIKSQANWCEAILTYSTQIILVGETSVIKPHGSTWWGEITTPNDLDLLKRLLIRC